MSEVTVRGEANGAKDVDATLAPREQALPVEPRPRRTLRYTEMPPRFFWIAFGYLIALLAVFGLYHTWPDFRSAIPDGFGPLPVAVPWFGAVGGALISLTGTFMHRFRWDHSYDYWHYARPWVGAVIGSVGVLILIAIVQASTTTTTPIEGFALYVVAFILGYRESTFRQLITRGTDLFFAPGEVTNQADGTYRPAATRGPH
jgi:hypothetical protein